MNGLEKIIKTFFGVVISGSLAGCAIPCINQNLMPLDTQRAEKIMCSSHSKNNTYKKTQQKEYCTQPEFIPYEIKIRSPELFLIAEPFEQEMKWNKEFFASKEKFFSVSELGMSFKQNVDITSEPVILAQGQSIENNIIEDLPPKQYTAPIENSNSKNNFPDIPSFVLHFLLSAGSFFALRYFLKRGDYMSLKKMYDFVVSLPELSKPGISERDVFGFLEKYDSDIPKDSLRLFAHEFVSQVPDKNEFSRLDLMILANTLKNNFTYSDESEVGLGMSSIVRNYDRSVMGFDSLQESVRKISKNISELGVACDSISDMLLGLNNPAKSCLLDFHNEYNSVLSAADNALADDKKGEAIHYFRDAIVCNPRRSEAYFGLAELLKHRMSYAGAFELFSDLLDSGPCDIIKSKVHLEMAKCYLFIDDYDSAFEELDKVDANITEKYGLIKQCRAEKHMSSGKVRLFLSKVYNCYLKPGFSYYQSTVKKKGAGIVKKQVLGTKQGIEESF